MMMMMMMMILWYFLAMSSSSERYGGDRENGIELREMENQIALMHEVCAMPNQSLLCRHL